MGMNDTLSFANVGSVIIALRTLRAHGIDCFPSDGMKLRFHNADECELARTIIRG